MGSRDVLAGTGKKAFFQKAKLESVSKRGNLQTGLVVHAPNTHMWIHLSMHMSMHVSIHMPDTCLYTCQYTGFYGTFGTSRPTSASDRENGPSRACTHAFAHVYLTGLSYRGLLVTGQPGHGATRSRGNQVTGQPGHGPTRSRANQVTGQPGHGPTRSRGNQVTGNQVRATSHGHLSRAEVQLVRRGWHHYFATRP